MKAQAIGTKAPDALRTYARNVSEGLKALIEEAGIKIVRLAQSRVNTDFAGLRASIRVKVEKAADKIVAWVTAGQGLPDPDVAAFQEWGTGRLVRVQDGLEDYALTFRRGKPAVPLQPSPYFYPSVFQVLTTLGKDIRTLVQTGKVPS